MKYDYILRADAKMLEYTDYEKLKKNCSLSKNRDLSGSKAGFPRTTSSYEPGLEQGSQTIFSQKIQNVI